MIIHRLGRGVPLLEELDAHKEGADGVLALVQMREGNGAVLWKLPQNGTKPEAQAVSAQVPRARAQSNTVEC